MSEILVRINQFADELCKEAPELYVKAFELDEGEDINMVELAVAFAIASMRITVTHSPPDQLPPSIQNLMDFMTIEYNARMEQREEDKEKPESAVKH